MSALKSRPPPRLGSYTVDEREQVDRQSALVRLLSITESFASELLHREAAVIAARSGGAVAQKIADSATIGATSQWSGQRQAFFKWFGISKKATAGIGAYWMPVETLAAARNAAAHGLGVLTRRQRPEADKLRTDLAVYGIVLDDDRLILTDASLVQVVRVCSEFLTELDLAMQRRSPVHR